VVRCADVGFRTGGNIACEDFIVEWITAAEVSARVESLITRHHGGDRRAAARRLGIEQARLTGLLSGDWRRFSLEGLAALVRGYGVSLDWLLGSGIGGEHVRLADDDRRPAAANTAPMPVARRRGAKAARGESSSAGIPAFPRP
jgi:hypothetical protein